ncbi:ras-GEF domain-containing family member 1A isoform X2 [Mus pahari]|nr:ras-GEF domain-containing family member 1A isoform X2 [Mus pahari]XP_029391419.1 ras-GEF domain-containing family member 1A isoform X2 [Mus pahari]XP_029391420.1 ras-GEF domain-containing family member 1A isoform X2 [Mus pahari]
MPQTSVVFSSILGPNCNRQVQPGMGERGGGASSGSKDLIFQDGRLTSGSLEALMEHLVPTVDYYPDRTYIFTFLLSSRVFVPPHDLLARVGQICLEQRQQLEAGPEKAKLKSFSTKIVQLLKEWTEAFPYDFQDEKVMAELKAIAHRVTQCDEENGTVKKAIAQMIQSLLLSLAARSQLQELREKLRSPVVDKGPVLKAKPPAAQKDILGVCSDPLVLAQQLTHIELERVNTIRPEDLMQIISHMDSLDNHRCRGDMTKTFSLEAYDNWFNCLSMLVATEVCRVVKKKHRTRMLEFFIDVARECFNIGNFNSMMAIISGMNLSPVARLKKTWSKVKTAKFDVLEHHMDPSSNFCNYRTALQGATQRSQTANSSREKIVIPVFNLFVKDIYFLHKIHTNHLPNGHINFKKFWEISRQIHEFMTWTQVECPFEKDKKIQSYVLTAPIYSEEVKVLRITWRRTAGRHSGPLSLTEPEDAACRCHMKQKTRISVILRRMQAKSGEASLAGVHFVYNFYEKEDGSYLTHQPLAFTQSSFLLLLFILNGAGPCFGEGRERVSWEMVTMVTSYSNEM